MIQLPEHPLPTKPFFGEKCNGCGLCCSAQLCPVIKLLMPKAQAPCPLLTFHDGRTYCSLVVVENRSKLPHIIADTLAIGVGCDSEVVGIDI